LAAARELGEVDVDVLLLDRDLYNTFQPLLYQVATGALNPGDITYALRSFAGRFPHVRFRRACVIGIDPARRLVRLDTGTEVAYDYLAEQQYRALPVELARGAPRHSLRGIEHAGLALPTGRHRAARPTLVMNNGSDEAISSAWGGGSGAPPSAAVRVESGRARVCNRRGARRNVGG
jgi:hypothetical protein